MVSDSTDSKWVAAYYPSEFLHDDRAKTIACLLFDKVVCHLPIANMACGGGAGFSDFFSDDPLVEEGVIELREEYLISEVEADFSEGMPWGTDEEFNRYFCLNVTAMALRCCGSEGYVPVTDSPDVSIPACYVDKIETKRASYLQAGTTAMQSLDLLIPAFATLQPEEILEVRERLRNELEPFRLAMLSLAPKVRSGITDGSSLEEVRKEAKYIAETSILPALGELERRLSLENGVFWRRLLQTTIGAAPRIALSWLGKGALASVIETVATGRELVIAQIGRESLVDSLRSSGGLGYLLSVSNLSGFRDSGNGS